MNTASSKSFGTCAKSGCAYHSIANQLRQEFGSGLWRHGDPLPSENSLSRAYGVSRKTIRKALDMMRKDGIIKKSQGKKSIINHRIIEKQIGSPIDFATEARNAGWRTTTKIRDIQNRRATITETAIFALLPASDVTEVSRIRFIDHLPAVMQTSVLPASLAAEFTESWRSDVSLYEILRSNLGIEIAVTEDVVTIDVANEQEQMLLKVVPGASLFRMHRKAIDRYGNLVEISVSTIRPDFYSFCSGTSK